MKEKNTSLHATIVEPNGKSFFHAWNADVQADTKLREEVVQGELLHFLLDEARANNKKAWEKLFYLIKEGETSAIVGEQTKNVLDQRYMHAWKINLVRWMRRRVK